MNDRQRSVLLLGTIAFVGMGIYPPWIGQRTVITSLTPEQQPAAAPVVQRAAGYSFIWLPPQTESYAQARTLLTYVDYRIDFGRLAVQWIGLAVLAGGLFVLLRDVRSPNRDSKARSTHAEAEAGQC